MNAMTAAYCCTNYLDIFTTHQFCWSQ